MNALLNAVFTPLRPSPFTLRSGLFLLALLFGLTTLPTLAQTTWTGTTNTDWNTATNWSAGLPDATDDVVIPSVANQPTIGASTSAMAYSVEVQTGASLSIVSTGRLTMNGSKEVDFETSAFHNYGTVHNSGQLLIGNSANASVGDIGLVNQATFTNNAGGTITIDRSEGVGLFNNTGSFINAGRITIGTTDVGAFGLVNIATFTNNAGGIITIDRSEGVGLFNNTGSFTNAGRITIGATEAVGVIGLVNQATFNNDAGGTITIDRSIISGLVNNTGSFTNAGGITFGATAAVGNYGLFNIATFTNNAGGIITIDRSTDTGLVNETGSFTNAGGITIGATADVGSYGLENYASFANNGCATLTLFATINNDNTFTNQGLLRVNTALTHTNTGFTNNGIIDYPQGNPIPNVTNNDLIIAPLTACASVSPALQIGGNNGFTAGSTWYTDGTMNTPAGTYDQATNTFTPTNLTVGSTYPLSFRVGDAGNTCPRSVTLNLTPNTPVVTIIVPSGATVTGSTITLPAPLTGVNFRVTGGVSYERLIVIDRINGFEIRQVDNNGSGVFPITRTGLFRLTVTGANGCQRTVEGVVQTM